MCHNAYENIISLDNLFVAWQAYRKNKRSRPDVQEFEFQLEDNIFNLHQDLVSGTYKPGEYEQFQVTDPKTRIISKAKVRDRLLHQAIYQVLYPCFDKIFIFDSYSCRENKGTHKAFKRLVSTTRRVSKNNTDPCWAIKMDIKKFFDSIDHEVLLQLLRVKIKDLELMKLLEDIVKSFEFSPGRGMPLGNLTSQLFANIYMDPLDKFVKHKLNVRHYLRYADDFLLLGNNSDELVGFFVEINNFLREKLKLHLHPNKVVLRKLSQGIDFVGYVALPHYQVPRKRTIKRILKKVESSSDEELGRALPSYLGYIGHVKSKKLANQIKTLLFCDNF